MTEFAPAQEAFTDILDTLRHLARDHLLFWRLEVGRLLLDRFYGGDALAYRDRSGRKDASFARFAREHADDLAEFGLSERVVRDCILVHIVAGTLPSATRDSLGYRQLLELTRVPDPTSRVRLAVAAVDQHWTVTQVQDAVGQAKLGNFYDTDAEQPGTQPAPPEPIARKRLPPGRLAVRAERMVADIDELAVGWRDLAGTKIRGAHQARLRHAVEVAIGKLLKMQGQLAK